MTEFEKSYVEGIVSEGQSGRIALYRGEAAAFDLTVTADIDERDGKCSVAARFARPGLGGAPDIQYASLRRGRNEGKEAVHALTAKADEHVVIETPECQLHLRLLLLLD